MDKLTAPFIGTQQRRWITCDGQCDRCQSIRLTWDEVEVTLTRTEFHHLVNLLEEAVFVLDLDCCYREGCWLRQLAPGRFQLGLQETVVSLSLLEFLKLVDLAHTAAKQFPAAPRSYAKVTEKFNNS